MNDGFSLAEVLLALVIISLIATTGVVYRYSSAGLNTSSELIDYLNDAHLRALSRAETITVTLDLETRAIRCSCSSRALSIGSDVRMKITFGQDTALSAQAVDREARIDYLPNGRANGALIEMQQGENIAQTIEVSHLTGSASLRPYSP